MTGCIGEPVSWLRLEQLAQGGRDAAADEHLAACAICARCLASIRADVVALPALEVAAPAPRDELATRRARRTWPKALPAGALAAAAALIVVIATTRQPAAPVAPPRDDVAMVKGVGEVVLGLVRERGGTTRDDVLEFAPGDRWKVVITCAPGPAAEVEVEVAEAGSAADRPLGPAVLACGNRVVLPGAFELTGTRPNRICVRVRAAANPRAPGEQACLTVSAAGSPASDPR